MSLAAGVALTVSPSRSAAFLSWEASEGTSRLVGVVDLIPAAVLLLGRRPSRGMLARTLLDAAICLTYARILAAGGPGRGRETGRS